MRNRSIVMIVVLAVAAHARAQPADPADQTPTEDKPQATPEAGWGTYEPGFGKGFNLAKTDLGDISISGYSLFRFIDQLGNDTFVDHLGNVQTVDRRRDLTLHRVLVYLNGWFYDRKFRFNTTVWAILSTQQVNVIGSLTYLFHPAFALTAGVYGLPGTRSLQDIWPYFLGSDRVMADDFFRPGFTSGIWASGEPVKGLKYKAMVGNGLSQVGVSAAQLTRTFATSASLAWMPTTDEFGDRGGYGDWEHHDELATRFGASFTRSREDRQDELATPSPDNNTIRLSDSLNAFATGALAPGVSLQNATYWLISADAGFKYEGLHLQGEYYYRLIDNLDADGPLPLTRIVDQGFYVQASYFAVPRKLCVYGITSVIFGQFDNPWEAGGGANYYPFNTHNFRLNLQVDYVHRSAASSLFGYYVGGQTGTTVSSFADLLF
jgi:hypothetical protein